MTEAVKVEQIDWKKANAARCPCRGSDDYCPCQNDPHLHDNLRPLEWRTDFDNAKHGHMLWLLVDYSIEDGQHALADATVAATIGFNQFDDTGEDRWQFAGWCWSHDHFTEGGGKVIGFREIGFEMGSPHRLASQRDPHAVESDLLARAQVQAFNDLRDMFRRSGNEESAMICGNAACMAMVSSGISTWEDIHQRGTTDLPPAP